MTLTNVAYASSLFFWLIVSIGGLFLFLFFRFQPRLREILNDREQHFEGLRRKNDALQKDIVRRQEILDQRWQTIHTDHAHQREEWLHHVLMHQQQDLEKKTAEYEDTLTRSQKALAKEFDDLNAVSLSQEASRLAQMFLQKI